MFGCRYKLKRVFLIFFLGVVILLGARSTTINSLTVGGNGDDVGNGVLVLQDGTVVVAGYTDSSSGVFASSHGREDFLVAKFDNSLALQWWKSFGGSDRDMAEAIAVTPDGGYVLVGLTESSDGDVSVNNGLGDFWVIKLSGEGELVWERTLGGSGQDHAYDVLVKPSGNIIVSGYTRSDDGDVLGHDWGEDFWIVELDGEGSLLRQWIAGAYRAEDCARRLFLAEDGTIYSTGYYAYRDCGISCNYVANQMSILKIAADGEIEWFNQLGERGFEEGFDLTVSGDGTVTVVGAQDAGVSLFSNGLGGKDFWVISLDDDGTEVWSKNYGGSFTDIARAIVQIGEDDFLVAGYSSSSDKNVSNNRGMTDGWLMVIDSAGKLKETLTVGGSKDDFILSLSKRGDSVFFTGYSESSDGDLSGEPQEKDLWVFSVIIRK